MISYYLKLAFRTAVNEWKYSLINILGLSLGLCVCLLILQFVYFEFSYDTFYKEQKDLYLINLNIKSESNDKLLNYEAFAPMGPLFKENLEEVVDMGRIISMGTPGYGNVEFFIRTKGTNDFIKQDNLYYADNSIINLLSLEFLEGNSKNALINRNSIIVSESAKRKIFGDSTALGKSIIINYPQHQFESKEDNHFIITGVYKDLPENSSFKLDILGTISTFDKKMADYPAVPRMGGVEKVYWSGWIFFTTIVKLREDINLQNLELKMRNLMAGPLEKNETHKVYYPKLTSFKDIHWTNYQFNDTDQLKISGDKLSLSLFFLLSILILVVSWINYINLSSARSIKRAKEVGLRKVNGASKIEIFKQFYLEAFIINSIALFIGLVGVQIIYPIFSDILESSSTFEFLNMPLFWLLIVSYLLLSSFIIGIYPVIFVSKFNTVLVLSGSMLSSKKGAYMREILVLAQFTIGMAFIASIYLISKQYKFMKYSDKGINTENVIAINLSQIGNGEENEIWHIKDKLPQFNNISGVETSSLSDQIPGDKVNRTRLIKKTKTSDIEYSTLENVVSNEYFDIFNHKLVAGEIFNEEQGNFGKYRIINEILCYELGFESPKEAIGKSIFMNNRELTIIGVIQDYHRFSLKTKLKGELIAHLQYVEGNVAPKYLLLKTRGNTLQTIEEIRKTWNIIYPEYGFDYSFVEDGYENQIKGESQLGDLFTIFSIVAIIISCLGLFGLSSYNTLNRTKEIGIRKVLGGSVRSILSIFMQGYLKMVVISAFIGIPIALYLINKWLLSFPYRVSFSLDMVIIPFVTVLILTIVTVGFQTLKAAIANPVDSLRNE